MATAAAPQGRNRFALEVARATAAAIGAERVGIRLSPHGVFNSTGAFPEVEAQYLALARELSALGLLYLHVLDHSAMGAPPVPAELKASLRQAFRACSSWPAASMALSAETALAEGQADLIAFARPFLANPDLVERLNGEREAERTGHGDLLHAGAQGLHRLSDPGGVGRACLTREHQGRR